LTGKETLKKGIEREGERKRKGEGGGEKNYSLCLPIYKSPSKGGRKKVEWERQKKERRGKSRGVLSSLTNTLIFAQNRKGKKTGVERRKKKREKGNDGVVCSLERIGVVGGRKRVREKKVKKKEGGRKEGKRNFDNQSYPGVFKEKKGEEKKKEGKKRGRLDSTLYYYWFLLS